MANNSLYSILATLSYADIFDFPLTKSEICQRLISSRKIQCSTIDMYLKNSGIIGEREGYYFLKKRDEIVALRKRRTKYSELKMKKAEKISSMLSHIPGVLFIGVSGSLAVGNCKRDDDIDFFIITKNNYLWTTRLLVNLALLALKSKRKRNSKEVSDTICVNMYLSEANLTMPKQRRNIYTAHEIIQIRALVNKEKTHERFACSNQWIEKFLPNARSCEKIVRRKDINASRVLFFLNKLLFLLQYGYMRKKITHEEVGIDFAYFHPNIRSKKILFDYDINLKQYKSIAWKNKSMKNNNFAKKQQSQIMPV